MKNKSNGIFYTKKEFTDFMASNIEVDNNTIFFDPTAGDGVFFDSFSAVHKFIRRREYDKFPASKRVKKYEFIFNEKLPKNISLFTNLPFRALRYEGKQGGDLFILFLEWFFKNIKSFKTSAVIIPKSFLTNSIFKNTLHKMTPYISEVWRISKSSEAFRDAKIPSIVLVFSSQVTTDIIYKDVANYRFTKEETLHKEEVIKSPDEIFSDLREFSGLPTLYEMGVRFKKGEIDLSKYKKIIRKGNMMLATGSTFKNGQHLRIDFNKWSNLYENERIVLNDIVNINKITKIDARIIQSAYAANSLVYISDLGCFSQDKLINYLNSDIVQKYLSIVQYNNHLPIKILNTIPYIQKNKENFIYDKEFKMSAYDLEISKQVPIGGNWKNISLATASKSSRIMKIRETGGRTTLYGRIDPNKPAYTITTYFNRPGNGAYLHPKKHRTLTLREAARIQTFPDEYLFYGKNQRDLLEQVGNAIPPQFISKIIKEILKSIKIKSALDLFSGGGGATIGISKYIKRIISSDIKEYSKKTHEFNFPKNKFMLGDISDNEFKKEIIRESLIDKVDVIIGGPPCQGFSLAGKRFLEDPRNSLYKDFIEVIKNIDPKVVIFENVQGINSFNKGRIRDDIIDNFKTLGYYINSGVFDMSEYGIPQKRKRFILIATKIKIKFDLKKEPPVNLISILK